MSDGGGEKRYQATARKLDQAREKGQVARSRELGPALAFLAVASVASVLGSEPWLGGWRSLPTQIDFVAHNQLGPTEAWGLLTAAFITWGPMFAALIGAAAGASVLAVAVQGGPQPTTEPLKIDPAKLDPFSKLKSLFTLNTLWETGRSLLAGAIACWIVFSALRDLAPELNSFSFLRSVGVASRLGETLIGVALRAGLGLVLLAVLDTQVAKLLFLHKLKMSHEEVKQEHKDQEGRPEVKVQRRRRQMELSRGRGIQAVRDADVVITNPTHYAVALSYRQSMMRAPIVVAKGRDRAADRIRREARLHEIPLVENPPLARELYRKVEVDQEIPGDLYLAVAEVIAYVMRLTEGTRPAPATETPGGEAGSN